jgi:hypothetical protein
MRQWRLAFILCAVNWGLFAAFMVVRDPHIDREYELDASRDGSTIMFRESGDALTHIAGRPLYSWRSWHAGEPFWIKAIEIFNAPALAVAHRSAPSLTDSLFEVRSYYLETWVRAWLFVMLATCQWLLVGWAISSIHRRVVIARSHGSM